MSYIQSLETPGYFTRQSITYYTNTDTKEVILNPSRTLTSLKHKHYKSEHPLTIDIGIFQVYKYELKYKKE